MNAENAIRIQRGETPAYSDAAFCDVLKRYDPIIGFNSIAAARKEAMPDCRNCVEFDESAHRCAIRSPIVCIGGDAFVPADPVRLYAARKGERESE